jgi:hypothetical protein
MVLIILDTLSGEHKIISVPIRSSVRQSAPAMVIEHPSLLRAREGRA